MTQIETLEFLVNSQSEQIRAQQQTNQMLVESNQNLTDQSQQLQKKIEELLSQVAISRKNFLFCGNHEAAENTAIICSLLATCKAQKVNPREWLNDVIAQLPGYLEKESGKEVKELLPNVWKTKKSNETPTQI